MSTIRSIQQDIDAFTQQSQAANDEAQRLQAKVAQHTADNDEASAARDVMYAQSRQKESEDFAGKADAKRSELARLQSRAQNIQSEMRRLQGELDEING